LHKIFFVRQPIFDQYWSTNVNYHRGCTPLVGR